MKNGPIDMDILLNPLIEKTKYQKTYSKQELEELSMKLKDEKEFNTKKKNFFYKEKILYNVLPNEHFQKLDLESTNLSSFEKYFKQEEDFNFKNFQNIMNIRKKYLETFFNSEEKEKDKDKEEEKEKMEEEKKDLKENLEEKEQNEGVYTLINDLKEILENFGVFEKNGENEDELILYFSIADKIFNNIFFELDNFYKNRDFDILSKYEIQLSEIVDSFENIFLSKKETESTIDKKIIYILYQLQKLSLGINSLGLFLKILRIMKKNNILFDNYNDIYKKYFKMVLSETFKQNEEKNEVFLEMKLKEDLYRVDFFIDEKYLYLLSNKKDFYLSKYNIENKEKILEKEIGGADDICFLNDKRNNKIKILLYQTTDFELFTLNKDDLSIEKEFSIRIPRLKDEEFKFTQIINSQNYFYLIANDKIFSLNSSEDNSYYFELFLSNSGKIPKNRLYYYIFDDYIFWNDQNYIDLHNKKRYGILDEQKDNNIRNYFDGNMGIKYSLTLVQKKKETELKINRTSYKKNKILMIIENNNLINKLEEKIEENMNYLKTNYVYKNDGNSTKKEKEKFDPFNYYINYNNNLDLILNSEDDINNFNYKKDEKLSKFYYDLLYFSIIKFYFISSEKYIIAHEKLILNIYNDLLLNEIKEIISEKKDYILLYIYTYFLILYSQNSDLKKAEIDKHIKIIIEYVLNLSKGKSSSYLFYILREIYKFKPEYMNDTYISENLLLKSDKLNIEEIIYNFSLVTLDNNKNYDILFKNFLEIEKKIILSEGKDFPYDKKIYNEVCQNFLNFLLNKKLYQFKEDSFWEKLEKIFIILIEDYNSLLDEYNQFIVSSEKWLEIKDTTIFKGLIKCVQDKKINILNDIKNSVVCKSLFLLINIIFYQIESVSENNKKKIINILNELLKIAYRTNKFIEYQENEIINKDLQEIIIINSDNLDLEKKIESLIPYYPSENDLNKLYMEYDFETNYENIKIGNESGLNYSTWFELKKLDKINNYDNRVISNDVKDNNNKHKKEYQRFKLKFANFKNGESYTNILFNIKKSIIFTVMKLNFVENIKSKNIAGYDNCKNNNEIEKKINDKKIREIISNEFFNNISILDNEDNIINIQEKNDKYINFDFKDIFFEKNNNIQKNYEILCKDINKIFTEEVPETNSININTSISSFNKKLSSNESYKKLIDLIHQEFIKKNMWGSMSDSLLRNIIISCFAIIVFDFDLINDFDDLVKILKKDEKLLSENEKLKRFIMIYTKINNLKKIFSKKKHEFSLVKDKNIKEEELLNKYMDEMRLKLDFITKNKGLRNDRSAKKPLTIEESIIFLLDFISDEKISVNIVIKKLKELNTCAINKERSLDNLNKMLFISDKSQDIKDIINCINLIIKNGKNKFKNYEKDLKGADFSLINNYKKQIYIFLTQIINKIKTDKDKYDISYDFILLNSLFWPFNQNDKEFLQISKLYEILLSPGNQFYSLLHDLNSKNYHEINMENDNILKLTNETLLNKAFDLLKLMTYIAINNIDDDNNDKNKPFIKYVFDLIFDIFNKYNDDMDKLIKGKKQSKDIINEEKLNDFLMIFYRCILNTKKIKKMIVIIQDYKNIFTTLFYIFIYSSTKNKILTLKIISILLIDCEQYINDSYLKTNCENIITDLKERNILLYNLLVSKKVNHIENIFLELLINFILLLQQNIENSIKYINGTENNFNLSLVIIKILQNKLQKNDNSKNWKEIYNFIEMNYMNKKYISVILQLLGIDFDCEYMGANIKCRQKEEKLIIIGYNNSDYDKEKQEIFNYKEINYTKGLNLCYINSEDISNSEYFKSPDFSVEIIKNYNISQNIKILENKKLILPIEKNEFIYKNLLKNISNFELKEMYLILKYIKLILLQEKINLDEEFISLLFEKCLDKEVLNFKCKIINIENLERLAKNKICEINKNILEDVEEKKSEENLDINTKTEDLFIDPYSPDILCLGNLLFYRFSEGHNLGYSITYKKILNCNIFNESNKFLKIFNEEDKCKKYNQDCILLTRDILNFQKISPNIKYIIIPETKDEDIKNIKITTTPIIILGTPEFKNIFEHAFLNIPFYEAETIFEKSLQSDASLLIDIPIERIAEFPENQRDFLLEILGIEPTYGITEKALIENNQNNNDDEGGNENKLMSDFCNKVFCGRNFEDIDINIIYKKLIAQISRRIIILTKIIQKINIEPKNLKKIIKLLNYEILTENYPLVEDKNYEIHQLIKNFMIKISANNEYDIIKEFIDLSFLESDKLISDGTAKSKETEEELINSENLNNNILLINMLFLAENAKGKNKSELLDNKFLFNYISQLIKQDLNLVIPFLVKIFKHIENNIDEYVEIITQQKDLFNCDEFKEMFNFCENLMKEKLNIENLDDSDSQKFDENTYEKIELIFSFFNIESILKYKYGINLDISYMQNMENSSLLGIHIILSILLNLGENNKNNNEENYYNFIELCYQKGLYKFLINNEQFTKPIKSFKFNYYDKNFDSNFVTNYQDIIPKNLENCINNISLLLKAVDNNIINQDNCVFIYESEKCTNLQEYIKINDKVNDKRILLISPNFSISFPNSQFKCNLYGSGSNDKNSLGIQDNSEEKFFSEPHLCAGLEECKNIVDFKFGYYHTFVQSSDQNLYTCGTDKGSSFKFDAEFPYFNKQTYFQSLSKENEGIKIISANNYNSSILVTNNNKMFCCGKNSSFCLGKAIKEENKEIDIPRLMPEFLPLIKEIKYPYIVKEVACGYRSSLFLLEDGYAFTCGSQDFSQCGSREKVQYYNEYFPLYPPRGTRFTHAVAGEEFFLLLVEEIIDCGYGKLYSLGQNQFGRSGAGELNTNYTLQRLEAVEDKDFTVISSRNENAAAISTEGILYTFGNNESCALGLGDKKNRFFPTKVSTLEEYYICDHVGISQNHLVIIGRERKTGKRVVLTCGDNANRALCKGNDEKAKFDIPTKIQFFEEKRPDEEPMKATLSRFQTYLMSIKVDLKYNINKKWSEFKCVKCSKEIECCLYMEFKKNGNINYYCQECALINTKNVFLVLNTINSDTKNNLEKILKEKDMLNGISEINFEQSKDKHICINCNKEIEKNIYQSYSNVDILLCEKCYMSKCSLIKYPQLFISCDKGIKPKIEKKFEIDKIIYPNIIKTEKPYLELDLIANYKKEYIIKELYQNKELRKIFDNCWKMINENILVEMRKLKDFYEERKFDYLFIDKKEDKKEQEEDKKAENEINEESNDIKEPKVDDKIKEKDEEEKKETMETMEERLKSMEGKNYEYLANIAGKSNKYYLYEIIQKLLDIRNKTNIKNTDFPNLDLYIKNPTFYTFAFSLSNFINFQILKILSLSLKFPFANNIFVKVLESSLKFASSQERKEIFLKNIEKNRKDVNFENEVIPISRIKANVFYKKNILDKEYQYTVFSQLFRKTRSYPKENYLCKKDDRLFKINLIGEGATDFSGAYNEIISIISTELESPCLDLFIKTPNNKNEIGSLRDKYMPNPKAKGSLKKDLYYFLGNLMVHSISSGNVLNLNLHPIFYKKILNKEIDFSEIESLDKLSYKLISNLENIKTEEEFNILNEDLYFAVHSSGDNSLVELVENGQYKKVTFDNLSEFINLYKKFLLTEYDNQISYIRSGIFDILMKDSKKNLSYLLEPEDLEEFITGTPILDMQLLREKTQSDSYESNSKVMINFWRALESFTDEERSLYLKFVCGRTRLPKTRNFNFIHYIKKLNQRNPDKYLPTSTTCYFTLNLPEYSTYEILRDKLRYVIHNCSSIDADFVPEEGADQFDEQFE